MHRLASLFVLIPLACNPNGPGVATPDDPAPKPGDTAEPQDSQPTGAPEAASSVSPTTVAPPFETAVFDGSASGEGISEYRWTLVSQPAGSAVELPTSSGPTIDLTPDLAGSYQVELVVVDESGNESQPATTWLTSTPSEALWIEMYWDVSPDDMDLHLLAPGGTLESDLDCYYQNCITAGTGGLDWGVPGDDTDNPALDLDDIPGTGPENINIDQPQDGEFQVWVHDYHGSNGFSEDYEDPNDVTVSVYIDSVLTWSGIKAVSGDDTDTAFCTITMPDGVVTGL